MEHRQPLKLTNKDGQFYIEDVATNDLATQYGTPLYVYSKALLDSRLADMQWFLNNYPKTRVAYAAKAFACKKIFQYFQAGGLYIDVVSHGELYLALNSGVTADKIEFNGNNKSDAALSDAVDHKIGLIIVDGVDEMQRLMQICTEKQTKQAVLLRVNPLVDAKTHRHIATATKESKFGVIVSQASAVIKQMVDHPYLQFKGIHMHIGSQLMDNQDHLAAINSLLPLLNALDEAAITLDILNIGGGFGVYYKTGDTTYDFKAFITPLMQAIDQYYQQRNSARPIIALEPGRYLVANAGATLYRAGTTKPMNAQKSIVAVDGGMTDNLRPMLYQAQYEAVALNDNQSRQQYSVVGKCCESSDVLINDIEMNSVKRDDLILVYNTGAYGYAMANNYNKNPIPAVVLVDGANSELWVKRQSLAQVMQNDV